MTAPHDYEIRVEGHLDDHWAAWLGGVRTVRNGDGTTTVTATLDDGAAVHGILTGLRDIGATLLSLAALDPGAPRAAHVLEDSVPTPRTPDARPR